MDGGRRRIETDKAPPSTGFRSQAVAAAGLLFTGGMIGSPVVASDAVGAIRAPAPTLEEQVDLCLRHLEQVTLAGGGDKSRVVEVSSFPVSHAYTAAIQKQVEAWLGYAPPLFNQHVVRDVAMHALLELDWIALLDPALAPAEAAAWLAPMGKEPGLHSSGPFLFLNGVTAVEGGETLGAQSEAVFQRAGELLAAAGSGLEHLVKMTVYIAEFDAYPQFNDVTKRLFAEIVPPTRSVIVAPAMTNPAQLRIDFVALQKR
jgi:2-iminobutanoate/2-iminopropanoate deaminase